MFMIVFSCFCFCLIFKNLFHSQTAQNGSGAGQSVDTAVYQQGAAVTYSQDGNEYSGQDGTTFKAQVDARVASLPSAGPALMGAYTGGAAGWYHVCWVYKAYQPYDLHSCIIPNWTWTAIELQPSVCVHLPMCSCHFIWGSDIWIIGRAAASHSDSSHHHSYNHTSLTGTVLLFSFLLCLASYVATLLLAITF